MRFGPNIIAALLASGSLAPLHAAGSPDRLAADQPLATRAAVAAASAELTQVRRASGTEDELEAVAHYQLAAALLADGNLAGAESEARAALAFYVAASRREGREAARVLTVLGETLAQLGRLSEALALLETAREATGGPLEIDTADGNAPLAARDQVEAASQLGDVLISLGQVDRAGTVLAEARTNALPVIGNVHLAMLRLSLADARLLTARGQLVEARRLYHQIRADALLVRGSGDPIWVAAQLGISALDAAALDHVAAGNRAGVAAAAASEVLGPLHRWTVAAGQASSGYLRQRGLVADAEALDLTTARGMAGLHDDDLVRSADESAKRAALAAGGGADEAGRLARLNAADLRKRAGADSRLSLNAELEAILLGVRAGGEVASLAELAALTPRFAPVFGDGSSELLALRHAEAQLLLRGAMEDRSDAIYADLIPRYEALFGDETPHIDAMLAERAWIAQRRGDVTAAEALASRAWERMADRADRDPQLGELSWRLAMLRSAIPERAAAAIDPARLLLGEYENGFNYVEDAASVIETNARRIPAITRLPAYLEAAYPRFGEGDTTEDARAAFSAIQGVLSNSADSAALRASVRASAARRAPQVLPMIDEREQLIAQWSAARPRLAQVANAPPGQADRIVIAERLAQLNVAINEGFPDYFALLQPSPVDLVAATALLRPDEALVMVAPTDLGTHVIALSRTGFVWHRLDTNAAAITAATRRLLFDVGAPIEVTAAEALRWQEEGGAGYPFARGEAYRLYTAMFGPLASVLEGKTHLTVQAGGALAALPLAMLVTDEPQGKDGDPAALRATKWLGERYALSTMTSVQALAIARTRQAESGALQPESAFIGYGDPLLEGSATSRGGGRGTRSATISLAAIDQLRTLASLPGTASELENMRIALGAPTSALHLGVAATEPAVRTADLRGARIISFATHGLLAGEISDTTEAGLVMTPPAAPSAADDGLLSASEIAALDLDAELVILSACNTASGNAGNGGAGLTGLAQAFFFAGARTLVASHWPVRDDVASLITVRTIEMRRDNPRLTLAEAFQRAMREIRDDPRHDSAIDSWAHPNAWAAFTLIGDAAR